MATTEAVVRIEEESVDNKNKLLNEIKAKVVMPSVHGYNKLMPLTPS